MDKLYMLEGCENEESYRRPIAYSHDVKKLKKLCFGVYGWSVGTDDVTNSPEVVAYSVDKEYPLFWIREVPFVI